LAAELLQDFESEIEALTLIPSDGGRFEFVVNDKLLYSKLITHRHAEQDEIAGLLKKYLKGGGV
jgi:selenoprotein W-related protein